MASETSIVFASLLLAGILKGASGLGFSSIALPLLTMAVDLQTGMVLIIAPVVASNLAVLVASGCIAATLRRFWPLYLGLLPGTAAGVLLMTSVENSSALQVLGSMTLVYVMMAMLRPEWRLRRRPSNVLRAPVGLATGVLTGLTGSQVFPLVPYLSSVRLDAREQIQAINIAVLIGSSALIVGLVSRGLVTADLAGTSLAGALPAIAGVGIGTCAQRALSPASFRMATLFTLTVLSLNLIAPATDSIRRDLAFAARPAAEPVSP